VHETPDAHVTHAPVLQTWFVPQAVPFARSVVVSMQVCVPVEHDVVPATHLFVFVEHETPAVQAVHVPLSHTWFVPQTVPFGSAVPVFAHVEVPVEHEVFQTVQEFAGVQSVPETQETHAPLSQTRFVPHVVPFATGVVEFTQVCVPVAQEVVPARQEFGFVLHAIPEVHVVHAPLLQTWPVPQVVPFTTGVVVSTQVCVPVEQDVVPCTHRFGFVLHGWPAVQFEQTPPLHTRFVPQVVPFALAVVESMHVWTPVVHDVTPVLHGSGFVEQVAPAVQGLHVPLSQTRFVPQVVPFATAVVVLTQVEVPVEHDVVPATHGFGFPEHDTPAAQGVHTPLSQTSPVAQTVPFAFGEVGSSTQAWVPVVQDVMPFRHGLGFVVQASPAVHVPHTPPLHTMFVPHEVPSCFAVPSTQTEVPVEHEVMPFTHAELGLVLQASPETHEVQVPPLQTWSVPQEVPFAMGVVVSTQVCVPVEQDVVPWTHLFVFVEHAVPATQDVQTPPLHTWSVPQIVPFGAVVVVSMHCDEPLEQVVVPRKQGFGFVLHATPAVHDTHEPLLQTRPVPQLVPFGFGVLSRQTEVPVEHDVTPVRQAGFGFVVQGSFEAQVVQVPALHT
jgi:hypothetical protein